MARQRPSKQLETIKKRQDALAKQFKEIKAKARDELKENERRINELVGGVIRKQLAAEPSSAFALSLRECLDKALTGANERNALKLSPLPQRLKKLRTPKGATPKPAPQEAHKSNIDAQSPPAHTRFGMSFLDRNKTS
jgi:hypothetical protein